MSDPVLTTPDALADQLATFRRVREEVERSVLPLATSVDGASFTVQASLHDLELARGGYVVLEDGRGTRLGQVTGLAVETMSASIAGRPGEGFDASVRIAAGSGRVLDSDGRPFHDALARAATPSEIGAWLERIRPRRAGLTIGELVHSPGVPVTLDSGGLARHTFMCGQSGSGKTYSLGLLLERVLAETSLRVIILDPNSDYVRLGKLRDDADPELAMRYARVTDDIAVWTDDATAAHPLRLGFGDLPSTLQAAVLGLDPIRDRDEYAFLTDLLRAQSAGQPLVEDASQLLTAETAGARQLGMRALNLGVLDWRIWDPRSASLISELRHPSARCTVVDLGSLDTVEEQNLVAAAVLTTLWEERLRREPCLVVIDEAHNVCSAEPEGEMSRISSAQAVQIAAEGRKYGLYLLASTQRPNKVHENVVSQCDNLLLMRMNSSADLVDLSRLFSFVPEGLVAGATAFRMGQALVVGKILPQPAYVQMGRRVSHEGGVDIPATWAEPR
ncbi:MAG: ATP-binding protein [Actinomycetota bacterium]